MFDSIYLIFIKTQEYISALQKVVLIKTIYENGNVCQTIDIIDKTQNHSKMTSYREFIEGYESPEYSEHE